MRNRLAELLLSLVAGRERASVILGDLLENHTGNISISLLFKTAISIAVYRPHALFEGALSLSITVFSLWFLMRAIGMSVPLALLTVLPSEIVAYCVLRSRRAAVNRNRPPTA